MVLLLRRAGFFPWLVPPQYCASRDDQFPNSHVRGKNKKNPLGKCYPAKSIVLRIPEMMSFWKMIFQIGNPCGFLHVGFQGSKESIKSHFDTAGRTWRDLQGRSSYGWIIPRFAKYQISVNNSLTHGTPKITISSHHGWYWATSADVIGTYWHHLEAS